MSKTNIFPPSQCERGRMEPVRQIAGFTASKKPFNIDNFFLIPPGAISLSSSRADKRQRPNNGTDAIEQKWKRK